LSAARAIEGSLPFTTLLLLAFGMGAASALAGAHELRLTPRHALFSSTFAAFASFLVLLVLPVSIYFYVFHGDWFLLYLVDVRHIPSALALFGFLFEGAFGVLGFAIGASCVRNQRSNWVSYILLGVGLTAIAVLFVSPERLMFVGNYKQYRGGFGLVKYGGTLLKGGLLMGGILLLGATFLVMRIRQGLAR
jgi:hypothetical protein